ncbi:ELOC protein, partial [Tricholaema leucomelas]|nr:ELOC protein [Tricholaema leucomelas]
EETYNKYEGPDLMYMKLASSDGDEFTIKKDHVSTSGTIKMILNPFPLILTLLDFIVWTGTAAENERIEMNCREIPSHILSKVCRYFTCQVCYTNSSSEIPEFPIVPEIAPKLLMAADFLDC